MASLVKDKRIEARADAPTLAVIAEAAALANESLSAFVVSAAVDRAEKLIARADRTFMPAEQFDAMISSLNDDSPIPELSRLFAKPRRIAHG